VTVSATQEIWNRASLRLGEPAQQPGDIALTFLIRFHSINMNGGLEHALEYLSCEDIRGAVAGFRYFNLNEVASLLEAAMACDGDESRLDVLEARYGDLIPSDNVLVTAFEESYTLSPSAFAPI